MSEASCKRIGGGGGGHLNKANLGVAGELLTICCFR